ncbi:unnamed protein product, partial [Brassica oleracea var. botrytis]
ASSRYLKRRAVNSCPSDDHRYSSSPAAIAAESSQHHLNLLVFASSVATTTVLGFVRVLINMHIVAFLEMANRVEASTNIWRRRAHSRHLISLYRSTGARPSWGNDSERDDELNNVVPARETTSISSPHQMILMTTILMETQKQLIMEILPTLSVLGELSILLYLVVLVT